MNLELYINQLRAERDRVDNTILALEGIALQQTGTTRRVGRPRKGFAEVVAAIAPKRRGRPPGSKNVRKKPAKKKTVS